MLEPWRIRILSQEDSESEEKGQGLNSQLELDQFLEVELLVINLVAISEVLPGSTFSRVLAITGANMDLGLGGQEFRPKGETTQWGCVLYVEEVIEGHVGRIVEYALDVAK